MTQTNPVTTGNDHDHVRSEYTSGVPTGHSRRRETPRPVQGVRVFYFCLSSIWGFAVGASAVATAVRLSGSLGGLEPLALVFLAAGLAVAVVGGLLTAAAYREARSRGRER